MFRGRPGIPATRDHAVIAAEVERLLPEMWRRAANVAGLRERILHVLADPRNGEIHAQIGVLARLFRPAEGLVEEDWIAWASYAFGGSTPQRQGSDQ